MGKQERGGRDNGNGEKWGIREEREWYTVNEKRGSHLGAERCLWE